ncbi:MAG: hypothetical protein R2730_15840 [Chitinophagales bacterium]
MKYLVLFLLTMTLFSCNESILIDPNEPQLIFKFKFDPTQERLDGFGNPSTIPDGNAGQSPMFNSISAHYIELAPDSTTLLGLGEILYKSAETNAGGATAIDFAKSVVVAEGEVFYSVPLSSIPAGTYDWLRVSLAYQNYDILLDATVNNIDFENIKATAASFIGYNTYISKYKVKDETISVNANKLQGYVGVETPYTLNEFQAPEGATTVPNPIFNTSPIEPGSCVVTGAFDNGLTITGKETEDIVITMSLSTNKSFEWKDDNGNGKYEPLLNEQVVDMGIRGLIPFIE